MAKKQKTEEELEAEREETARVEQEKAEAHRKELDNERQKAHEAEVARARAEAQAETLKDAMKSRPSEQQQKEWTEEEWAAWEEKNKMSRHALAAMDTVINTRLTQAEKAFEERMKQAEDRAKVAEQKYSEFEKSRGYDNNKRAYFAKKPQFSRYEKEFDEFVSEFPEEIRRDPVKLESIFNKAEIYIKGKIGGKMPAPDTGGSHRMGKSEREDDKDDTDDSVDLSDLRAHERLTIEKIIPSKERTDELKKYRHDLKGENGVMISGKEEWDKYKK